MNLEEAQALIAEQEHYINLQGDMLRWQKELISELKEKIGLQDKALEVSGRYTAACDKMVDEYRSLHRQEFLEQVELHGQAN